MAKKIHITSRIMATSTGKVASIRITDLIGEYADASSRSLRMQVDAMIAEHADTAEVYINSRGGDVFEASEIANELGRFKNVTIRIGALAASAATYITSKFKAVANANSQLMIHRPKLSAQGDVVKIENDLKLLKNITENYKATYMAKTGKTDEEIEALWAKGDYWMTAKEALKNKFIDEIAGGEAEAVTAEDVALLEACGAPVIPDVHKTNQNTISDMERNKIIAALGLAADATDEQIEARAAQLKLKSGSYDTLIAAQKEANEKKAKTLVADAVKAKKITEAEAEKYEKQAVADYDFVAGVFAKLGSTPKLSAQLNTKPAGGGTEVHADWTLQDYLDKDPDALAKMYEEDPERAAQLEATYFK